MERWGDNAGAAAANHHCTVIRAGETGIMIEGAAGSGKTSLALGLIEALQARGIEALLVCDDQAFVGDENGKLVAHAPVSIRGKAELRGFGIVDLPYRQSTELHLLCRLVADERMDRMPEQKVARIGNLDLPLLELPARHEAQSIRIILAWCGVLAMPSTAR